MINEKLLGDQYRFKEERPPKRFSSAQEKARDEFLKRIHGESRYILLRKCPYCGGESFTKISEVDAIRLPSEIVICDSCDGCFKSKILNAEANRYYYENISYTLRGKDSSPEAAEKMFNHRVKSFAYPKYSFIRHFVKLDPCKDLIVEFGCGDGANLLPWEKGGFDVLGIELNPGLVVFGRSKGLNLISGDFMTHDLSDRKPKLVILSHLLEHVTDVNMALKRINSILDPQGYLFVEVPGIRGQSMGKPLLFFDVEHNFYFDLKSLSGVLNRNQFGIIYGDEYIRILCKPSYGKVAGGRGNTVFRPELLALLREAEAGGIRTKVINKLKNTYFKICYSILSVGARHDKA